MSEIERLFTAPKFAPVELDGDAGEGSEGVAVEQKASDLEPETVYEFRILAESEDGESEGELLSFTTLASPKPRRRQKPPLALDVEVETPDGYFSQATNSRDPGKRPRGISFATQRGDGFATGGVQLSRKILKDYPDIQLLDTWRFIGRNGDVAYEGRLHSNPRTTDPQEQIDCNLVGWMTYLKSKEISPLIVHRGTEGWGNASLQRRVNGFLSGWSDTDSTQEVVPNDGGKPGLRFAFQQFTAAAAEQAEMWFYGGGEDIAEMWYDFQAPGFDSDFYDEAVLCVDDVASGAVYGTNHKAASASNQSVATTAAGKKFAYFVSVYGGAAVGSYPQNVRYWREPVVVGRHGLTKRNQSGLEFSYYLTDIMRYIVETYYPKLQWAGEENTFPISHASWHNQSKYGYDILAELNQFALWELEVFEDRKLYFHGADLTNYNWQISTEEKGVTALYEGDSLETFANGVRVTFEDFSGIKRTITPAEYTELRDENENNPANRQGEDLWTSATISKRCTLAEALQYGRAYLAEFNRPKRPGSFLVTGYILDSAGHWQQGWKPRCGESILVTSHLSDEPRLITATNWDDETKLLRITVDHPDQLLDAVVARHEQRAREKGEG